MGTTGLFACQVTDGDSTLLVFAKGDPDGGFETILTIDGIFHSRQAFYLFDVGSGLAPNRVLQSATFEPSLGSVAIAFQFLDTATGLTPVVDATFDFALDDFGNGADITENIALTSTVSSLQTRLYAVTDFDLEDTDSNDSATGNGTAITFTDGASVTTGVLEVVGGSAASGFEASLCCDLPEDLEAGQLITLTNAIVTGPEDLLAAFSFDKTFGFVGDSLQTTLMDTVTVPEPAAAALQGVSLMTLSLLARGRGRRRRPAPGVPASTDDPR